jgi:hypothetical protein
MEKYGYIVVRDKETIRQAQQNGSNLQKDKRDAAADFKDCVKDEPDHNWYLCKVELGLVVLKQHRKVTKKEKKS